jgi:DNA-binding NtrC family response regulator
MIFRPAILYVDDEQANLDTFKRAFGSDYVVKTVLSGREALEAVREEDFPLVVADERMPGMTGIELCEKLVEIRPQTVRMILTAYTDTQLLLDAIHRGRVHDYIVKPWRKSELKPILDKAFEDYKQRMAKLKELEERASQTDRLKKEIQNIYDFEAVIGASSGLREAIEMIRKAAPTDSTVLLVGETGTGKELMARAVHANSRRRGGPFIPLHCAAVPETLLESELFGHERGAFTGADHTHIGLFETANGGTVFLDEVGEIPEPIQVKLLRVLQEREVQRLGGNRTIPIEVRLVAATNRDLERDVQEGRFREDLFYRLNVIRVALPPLRNRKEDIPALARCFLQKCNRQTGKNLTLSDKAAEHLGRYDWPGNVRELENIIERAVILSPGPTIDPEDLNLNIEEMLQIDKVDLNRLAAGGSLRNQIEQKEVQSLMNAIEKSAGNISEAARLLGMARSTLFYRLKKYKLI